jgi:two-component system nitrogen regulation response regulator GlnG
LDAFQRYRWPGNVRQLRVVIRDAALRAAGPLVTPDALPQDLDVGIRSTRVRSDDAIPAQTTGDLGSLIDAMMIDGLGNLNARLLGIAERELIARTLRHTHGHLGQACQLLGVDRKTLRNKLRDLGIAIDKVVTDRSEPGEE